MNLETIERDGQEFAVVPIAQYEQLLEDAEMLADIQAFREAKAVDEETFPGELIHRIILEDENEIKVFREYRGLTLCQLADKAGIQRADLEEIETGRKSGSIETLKAIASALNLDLDDIT